VSANAHSRVDEVGSTQRLKAQIGKVVGHILPVFVPTSNHNRDGKAVRDGFVHEDVQTFDELQGFLTADATGFQIIEIVRCESSIEVTGHNQVSRVRVLYP
jgi:hypothetical protein